MASTADTWELHPQRRMSHSHRDSADTTLSASVTPLTAEIGVPGSSLYLFSIRGRDQPGISHLMCQTIADFDQSTLLDISQICIDELLMLSLLVKVDDEHVAALTKELLLPANRMGVSVSVRQLHDDSGTDSEGGERPASLEGDDGLCGSEDCLIQVVYHPPKGTVVECLPPALLLNVCSIATREGWSVVSVVHFNPDAPLWVHSLQLRVRQTGDFHPEEPIKDDIYNAASHPMGSRQRLYLLLQEVCHRVGAEVVVRPYEAPSKPKPKSLVVFGLSEVLVSNDVLMTLLKEAGKDYEGIRAQCEKQKLSVNETSHRLVAALEGASRDVVSRTIAQLRLTKGARKVCQALKYLGFKLALITSSASQSIARHVQSELGLDYALATEIEVDPNTDKITGKHGTLMDNFRKVDYMRLIADRENISQENVIVVGDYVHADYLFDQCGYRIHFNSRQQGDLRVLLHLLGYSETHVRELVELSQTGPNDSWNTPSIEEQLTPANSTVVAEMDTTSQDDSDRDVALVRSTTLTDPLARSVWDLEPLEGVSPDSALERCDIRVIGPDAPGLMELLLGPVVKTGTSIGQIVTYNLHGVFCMGMQIYVTDPESRDDCLKDILFITHGRGMDMQYSTQESLPTLPSFADLENPTGHSPSDVPSLVVTLVEQPILEAGALATILQILAENNMNISVIRRLDESDGAMSALQFVLNPSDTQTSTDEIRSSLREKLLGAKCVQSGCVDCAVQVDDIARLCRRLVVFDMDSTLVEGEVIDELAKLAGVEKEVSAITSKAMHGEIDFFESLKQRVALLKGASAKYLIDEVESRMKFTPGARQLTKTLKAMGFKMAVISGGFLPFAQHTKKELGLDYAYANELEIDSNGLLCGRTVGPVVTPQRKRNLLVMLARVEGVRVDQAIAVGDGANDIPMLTTAGLGVAFCAKPKVQEQANFRVNNKDLSTILYLVGLTQADIGKAEDA